MPAALEPIRRIKCTFKDCNMSFDTEKAMRNHKKYSDEHEFCDRCNEDFECYEDYVQHKIVRPNEHDKACRVCGEEYKSEAGLKRHIEFSHKIDQKLTCIGCHKSFYRACLFIEHLEFGHCSVIPASQFQGYVVHKYLISEFLKNNLAMERFQQKISKFVAAQDHEEEGGIDLEDPLGADEELDQVHFEAIEPDTADTPPVPYIGSYPPLPSQSKRTGVTDFDITSTLGGMSLSGESATGDSETSTVAGSAVSSKPPQISSASLRQGSSTRGSATSSTSRQSKAWGGRDGKTTSSLIFPNAKPKAPSEFSIAAHDRAMEDKYGPNILRTHFWDPMGKDWNPEKFFDSVMSKYACPFVCEQTFDCVGDLNDHILEDHRITRMKCPTCLKYYRSATALMSHCESRGAKCQINKAEDFNLFLDRLSGGFLAVQEKIRPDHLKNPKVTIENTETKREMTYSPPVAKYLQYKVTTPPDWQEPQKATRIGGFPQEKNSVW